jgi:hypothetical protein
MVNSREASPEGEMPGIINIRSTPMARPLWFKVKVVLIGIGVIVLLILYSFFVADTIRTKITDAQMTKVDGRYMIATEYRPFVNYDAWYRFKVNSGTVQNEAIRLKGREVFVKKYGWRISLFSMYENVVSIKEVK